MASVSQQALLMQGGNAFAGTAGWFRPLSVVGKTPNWRDTSGFNSYGAWLAAIAYAPSALPTSITWQLANSLPNYLLTRSRRLSASITDDSSLSGSWIYAGVPNPTTPRALAWQQPLSASLHSNTVSRLQAPSITDPSSFSYAWLQAASVSAEASAFLARTSGLNATHTNAYIALINGLVTDGIWAKLDVLYIYATQDSTTALLNLVSTSYNGTANGSPSFSVDLGYTGANGNSGKYINTGFNPSTASSPKFTRNSGHLSVWSQTSASSNEADIGYLGAGTSASTVYATWSGDGKAYFRINSAAGATQGVAGSGTIGHFLASRTSSTALAGYKNGSSVLSLGADTSAAVTNATIYTIGCNNNGVAFGNVRQHGADSIGAGLSSTEVTNFYNRLRTYMTAVGVP